MIAELTLSRLGETMETGRVVAWLKQPGDRFRRGETLVEIETDKTVVEMPALANGVLKEILIPVGQDADVGAVLCRYEDNAEAASAPVAPPSSKAPPPSEASQPQYPAAATVSSEARAPAPASAPGETVDRPRATPLARVIARQTGVDLAGLTGTGRRGRIEAADVRGSRPAPDAMLQFVDVPGGRIAYRDWPAAPSSVSSPQPGIAGARIMLLHGLAGDLQGWAALAAVLARAGRRCTAFDLPGHGGTSVEAADLDGLGASARAFLERLGDDPVELVGHSLGGAVAARLAGQLPGRVKRLTLLAPVGLDRGIDTDFIRGIVRVRAAGALQHLLRRLVVRPAALTTAQREALVAELSRGRLLSLAEQLVDDGGQQLDITGDLRSLAIPVRVVWGVQDRIIPWIQVSQAGSRCAIHLIQDAGHVPHWDQPAEVAALFA